MLELPGQDKLATWRLLQNPLTPAAPGGVPAERIGDHRRAYLDCEGDIGGGRGRVRRLDRGAAEVESFTEKILLVMLEGTRLRGAYAIERMENGILTFRPIS